MILILHHVIDIVLLVEGKPMGAVSDLCAGISHCQPFYSRDDIADVSLL